MEYPTLTEYDLTRYGRQIMLFGEDAQRRLKATHLLVAGAGGLGSPVCTYLAVAGIGHLRVVDFDKAELSNLNRQILHWDEDVGRLKVESAREKLTQINPSIEIEIFSEKIEESNVDALVGEAVGIVDCMDNFPTRYVLNRATIRRRIPFFHAAVYGFEARVTTFVPGETSCLRCLFGEVAPSSAAFPVVGAAPGVAASIQAMEVIKYFSGFGTPLKDRLLIFDGEAASFRELKLRRDPSCPDCGSLYTQAR
jgi:molybdopterin/thiamine biosynthesis adenylyltransferase